MTAGAVVLLSAVLARGAGAPLTIYEIQSSTLDGDSTTYQGQVIDCVGGIVTGKYHGMRPRIILQDPANFDGWGGIQVKDWTAGDLFDHVAVGDWVSVTNVLVEEYRGTTFLQWQTPNNPGFTIVSQDNPLPPPIVVSMADIAAPIRNQYDEWYVENHDAERYESMRVRVRCAVVTEWNLGKAVDNYNLQGADGADCWAADYMNEDREPSGYHPYVMLNRDFCAVTGVLEQYTNRYDGWDYYQLLTLRTDDLVILCDRDGDGDVDLTDWPRVDVCFTGPLCDHVPGGCDPPEWTWPPVERPVEYCWMMDTDCDGDVDLADAAGFQRIFGAP
jgi:hypothetical protein